MCLLAWVGCPCAAARASMMPHTAVSCEIQALTVLCLWANVLVRRIPYGPRPFCIRVGNPCGCCYDLGCVYAISVVACTPRSFGAPVVPGQGIEEEGIAGTLDAPSPRTGTDTVTVALVGGAQLPTEMAQAFTEETGFSVAVVPIDGVDSLPRAGADVVLGLDGADAQQASQAGTIAPSGPQDTVTLSGTSISGVPAAVAYGRAMCA